MTDKNYKVLFKYLRYNDIKIDYEEFKLQMEGHPAFPSLLSYSDTLKFFNIENALYELSNDEINILPEKFIALSDGEFLLIEDKNDNSYFSNWDNVVLVVSKMKSMKGKTTIPFFKIFCTISILFILLLFSISSSYLLLKIIFLLTAIIGLFLGFEAYKKTHGKGTVIPLGVCKSKVLKTDCDFVFNAKRWSVLKYIDMSEVSIVFFVTQISSFLILFLLNQIETLFVIYKFGLILFIPLSLLSVFYQLFVVKKLCPVCIGIIICVVVQLISLFTLFTLFTIERINLTAAVFYFLCFAATFLCLYYWKIRFAILQNLEDENKKFIKFRKNYSFFLNNLSIQKKLISKDFSNTLQFGNRNSKTNLTLVTNLYCKHCKEFYPHFMRIVNNLSDKLSINIVFDVDLEKKSKDSINGYIELVEIYNNVEDKNNFLEVLNNWYIMYAAIDKQSWYNKYSKYFYNESDAVSLLEKQRIWLNINDIYYTPSIFINDLEYPSEYERIDIEYFISEVLEDAEGFN